MNNDVFAKNNKIYIYDKVQTEVIVIQLFKLFNYRP